MVVVGTHAHRGATVLQRAFIPIVFFAMICGKGGQGSLSHSVSSVDFDASLHGGASQSLFGTGGPHVGLWNNNATSGWMKKDVSLMGKILLEVPNAPQQFSPSCHTFPTSFDVVPQDPQHANEVFHSFASAVDSPIVPSSGYIFQVDNGCHSVLVRAGTFESPRLNWISDVVWGVKASFVYRIKRSLWRYYIGYAKPWAFGASCFASLLWAFSMVCVQFGNSLASNALYSFKTGIYSPSFRPDVSIVRRYFFLCCLSLMVEGGGAVTCTICFDQISGCAGGAACPLLTSTAANAAAITAAGAAVLTVSQLLPFSYVRHLSSDVLRALQAIARAPSGAAPVDLTALDEQGLVDAYQQGRADMDAIRCEIGNRVADPGTNAARVVRLQAISTIFKDAPLTSTGREIEGCQTVGGFSFCLAVASHIVKSEKATYSVGTGSNASSSSDGARRGGTTSRLSIVQPTSLALFAELLHVWQSILHALGLSNALVTTQFLQEVVFDAMSQLLFSWEQAYCLLLIYIEAIESHPLQFNLGNVFGAGSQDTRCKAARERASRLFKVKTDPGDGLKGKQVKWNGKDTPDAKSVCFTFNLGSSATHPAKSLLPDGTCKFRHCCNQFVTGKGKAGICEGAHARVACDNPGKCDKPADA